SFLQHKLMQQLNDKLLRANQAAEAGTRAKSSFLNNRRQTNATKLLLGLRVTIRTRGGAAR
ncbi:hypothetical protein ACSZMZ_15160, partial [Aeromonas veronii]